LAQAVKNFAVLQYLVEDWELDVKKFVDCRHFVTFSFDDAELSSRVVMRFGRLPLVGCSQKVYNSVLNSVMVYCKDLLVIDYLVSKGIDIHATNESGETWLHLAASYGRLDVVKFLVEHGVSVHARCRSGKLALHSQNLLHYSLPSGSDASRYLLKHGVDAYARNTDGRTPLDLVNPYEYEIKLTDICVIEQYVTENIDQHGPPAMHFVLQQASYQGMSDDVLIPQINNPLGTLKPLAFATILGMLNEYNYSLSQRYNSHNCDESGRFPLHIAASLAVPIDVVFRLDEMHPDAICIPDLTGALPINLACQAAASLLVVKFLCEQEAKHRGSDKHGILPSLQHPDCNGCFPLHLICASGLAAPKECIFTLLDMYLNALCVPNATGSLPLHLECQGAACTEVIQCLYEREKSIRDVGGGGSSKDAGGGILSSLQIPNDNACLPLHLLCVATNPQLESINFLLQEFPAAI
jgi:Ankyrin repeats (many copies)